MRFLKKYIRKLYHLIWFLGVFLIFIPNVFAVTGNPNLNGVEFYTAPAATFLDNTNENLTSLSTSWNNTGKYYSADITYNGASTAGANLNITTLEPIRSGYTYALSVLVGSPVGFKPSTKRVCIAENLSNNIYRWEHYYQDNSWCVVPAWTDSMGGVDFNIENSSYPNTITYSILYYIFTSNFSARSIMIAFNANEAYTTTTIFGGYRLQILSDNNTLSQNDIQSAVQSSGLATANSVQQVQQSINQIQTDINSSANNIINNNNQNTQDIINSSGSNTQSIINNQNENSEKEIESQKVCKYIDKSSITLDNKYLSINGEVYNTTGVGITNYININSSTIEVLDVVTGSANSCFYNSNKELISCVNLNNTSGTITIPSKSQYFRATISKSQNKPTFNICQNGNQAIDDSLNNIDDTLNNSSVDSSDDTINNLKTQIPTNSVISDLLLLPVRFLQNFVNALGSSCSQFSLGSLYGTELFMPCINIDNYLGSGIWTAIDLIISGMFVYALRKKFIEIYENMTNLRNGGNEVD